VYRAVYRYTSTITKTATTTVAAVAFALELDKGRERALASSDNVLTRRTGILRFHQLLLLPVDPLAAVLDLS